jgi:hypothetical protein
VNLLISGQYETINSSLSTLGFQEKNAQKSIIFQKILLMSAFRE